MKTAVASVTHLRRAHPAATIDAPGSVDYVYRPMKFALSFLTVVCALGLVGCGDPSGGVDRPPKPLVIKLLGFRPDVRTITVQVPQMKALDCQQRIQDALAKTEGVQTTTPDLASRKIDVTYDALKLGIKNIEYVIAGAGFDANDTPAPKEAREALPAECR